MALVACWLLVSFISLNHLYPIFPFFSQLPTRFLGALGWSTAFLALVVCGREHLRPLFVLGLFFGLIGFLLGPFLDPPADPLEHLRRIHELNCGKTAEQVYKSNKGLWHYSMAGVVLCVDGVQVHPEKKLTKIDITNGLFWALLSATLYLLAIRAGLPGKWAFLSVLICFLFFGTNRFSYFRYYSLAPSFSSMLVYWLWTALFFFKKKPWDIVLGLTVAMLSIPVIWVNHRQEAVFLGFIVLIWILVTIAFTWGRKSLFPNSVEGERQGLAGKLLTFNGVGLIILVVACWLLPQFDFFLQWLSGFFIRENGQNYQAVFFSWHGLYLGGKIARLRVMDTVGMAGILSLLVSIPYFWPGFVQGSFERRVRIFLLAVLPFIGYFVPLFHFVWSSNVIRWEYYRLCYMSIFWLLFADFFRKVEPWACNVVSGFRLSTPTLRRMHLKNDKK